MCWLFYSMNNFQVNKWETRCQPTQNKQCSTWQHYIDVYFYFTCSIKFNQKSWLLLLTKKPITIKVGVPEHQRLPFWSGAFPDLKWLLHKTTPDLTELHLWPLMVIYNINFPMSDINLVAMCVMQLTDNLVEAILLTTVNQSISR